MAKASDSGVSPAAAFDGLERAVSRLLDELEASRGREAAARKQLRDTQKSVKGLEGAGGSDVLDRLRVLESENGDLKSRLSDGRAIGQRLQAKIRFLEERR